MKGLIKILLDEAVGVPVGIAESAREVFEDLMYRLKYTPESKFNNNVNQLEFDLGNPNDKYNFADFQIAQLYCSLVFEEYPSIDKMSLVGLQVSHGGGITEKGDLKFEMVQIVNLKIRIGYPSTINFNKKDVIDLLEKNKLYIIPSLGHELKHSYDKFKNPVRTLKQSSQYNVYSEFRVPQQFVNEFMFNMYYMTQIEELVRPSEVYTLMNEKKITKKGFLNFFLKTNTFERLKSISNSSFEKFIQDIKTNMRDIEIIIMNFDEYKRSPEMVLEMSEEEKINIFLNALFITLYNKTLHSAQDTLKLNDPFAVIFMPQDEHRNRVKAIERMEKEMSKYEKNPRKYFVDTFKKNQINSQKIIQRISKVYSLLGD